MKIYFAEISDFQIWPYAKAGAKRFLVSYFYQLKNDVISGIYKLVPDAEIFLDSGAYSAFTLNEKINLDEYIEFCKANKDRVAHIASLDDIKDAEKTKQNYDKMTKAGLKVIPTYHIYEPYSYLDYYIKKSDYIAIGGLAIKTMVKKKRRRINAIMDVLDRIPKNKKIHLFGTTDIGILYRVNDRVTSVDSTTSDRRSVYNRTYSVTGMIATIKRENKSRLSVSNVHTLWVYSIYKWLQAERELNAFKELKELKCQTK